MKLDQAEAYKKNSNNKSKITCYKCGKPGHYARNCYSKGKARVNNIEEVGKTSKLQNNKAEFIYITKNKERLLKFNGQVNGKRA